MENLHSRIIGKGKAFVILHGFLGMSDNWKTLGKAFAEKGFQIHLVDQRNHGRSFHHKDFNYDLMCADLYRYAQAHHIEKMVLLGHSMGGKTAMEFACRHPEKVDKLIVADIAPKYYPEHHQTILAGLQAIDFDKVTSRKAADDVLSNYIKELPIRQFLLKNLYWREKGVLDFRFHLEALIYNIKEVGKALAPDWICDSNTLFLRGANSSYILESDHEAIRHQFPNSKITSIPDTGHWLHAEDPKQFFDMVMAFLYPT
ncbi:MAG: alpha/beta fold hydrolase [Flavobacteriaceae bacterium]|nr:alpha/beta fold hydrolase [Flavobacteriaceae bacterium]